ncbi:MAG: hypothetical protein EOO35_00290 [Cyanobacteriota bacterium]|nr:MAG: hypothetical protein EOO35_00290 [Cyanobacteriota bacterium]
MNNSSAIGNKIPLLPDPRPYGFRDFVTGPTSWTRVPFSGLCNASLEIEKTLGTDQKQKTLQKIRMQKQGPNSGSSSSLFASASINKSGLYKSTFATTNKAAMSAPAQTVFRVERPPSSGSLFSLFIIGGVLGTIVFVPVIEKGQDIIRNWLKPQDSSINKNSYSNSIKGESFKQSMEILKEYNHKNLTFLQAHLLLEKTCMFDSREIERMLKIEEVKLTRLRDLEEG